MKSRFEDMFFGAGFILAITFLYYAMISSG